MVIRKCQKRFRQKLYEEYLSGKRDLKSIAAEVFKNEIDLLNNRDNQIKR